MKKIILFSLAVVTITLMTSCDTKACRCYIYDGVNPVERVTEYVDAASSCYTLDYTRGKRYRTCTEYNDQDINPDDIGQEYKK